MAPHALLRGAVENSGCAIWLLGPRGRERITNRLGLEWKELTPTYTLRKLVKSKPPRTIDQRRQQLVELLIAAGLPADISRCRDPAASAKAVLNGVDYAAITRHAGELSPVGP